MTTGFELITVDLGYGRHMTLGQLLDGWERHVSRIADEMYAPAGRWTWGAHDYFAALHLRDSIDRAATQLSVEQRVEMVGRLDQTDILLLRITEPDDGALVLRFGRKSRSSRHWWWHRLPLAGLAREDLELWLSRAGSTD